MLRTTTCAVLVLLPTSAAAQGLSLAPFTAVDRGLEEAPTLVGLSATAWAGAVGLRLGGALDAGSGPLAPVLGYPPADGARAWTADLDLVIPGRAVGIQLGPVEPSAFVGFGFHGRRDASGETATIPAWSYGVGASLPLTTWLSIDGDARYRMPHESDADLLPEGVGGGLEIRAGASIHVGRTRRSRATAAPTVRRRRTIRLPGGNPRASDRERGDRGGGTPGGATSRRSASAAAVAERTLDTADEYVGVRYVWGGETPAAGFDCSGFVQYVFGRNGVHLPRVSRQQARAGEALPARIDALAPGDLMFFAGGDGVIDHVAIYVGDGRIIHSSASGSGVRYDDLDSRRARWYASHFVAARRVIADGTFFIGS